MLSYHVKKVLVVLCHDLWVLVKGSVLAVKRGVGLTKLSRMRSVSCGLLELQPPPPVLPGVTWTSLGRRLGIVAVRCCITQRPDRFPEP